MPHTKDNLFHPILRLSDKFDNLVSWAARIIVLQWAQHARYVNMRDALLERYNHNRQVGVVAFAFEV